MIILRYQYSVQTCSRQLEMGMSNPSNKGNTVEV